MQRLKETSLAIPKKKMELAVINRNREGWYALSTIKNKNISKGFTYWQYQISKIKNAHYLKSTQK